MTRTFWLSFCEPDRPPGLQFVGVCVIDVTEADLPEARERVRLRFLREPDDEQAWLAAATLLAHRAGCNPGGEIAIGDVTDDPDMRTVPRNRLLSKGELWILGLIES